MLAANGSIFTILAISFERYYAICKPLKAGYKCTRLRATIIICIIWLLASVLTSPILIMAESLQTTYIDGSLVYNCILQTDSYWAKMYVFVSMFAFFCLPLLVLMLVYWLISKRLIRENLAMSSTASSVTASGSVIAPRTSNATMTCNYNCNCTCSSSKQSKTLTTLNGAPVSPTSTGGCNDCTHQRQQLLLREHKSTSSDQEDIGKRAFGGRQKAASLRIISGFFSPLHHHHYHPFTHHHSHCHNNQQQQQQQNASDTNHNQQRKPQLQPEDVSDNLDSEHRRSQWLANKAISLDHHLVAKTNTVIDSVEERNNMRNESNEAAKGSMVAKQMGRMESPMRTDTPTSDSNRDSFMVTEDQQSGSQAPFLSRNNSTNAHTSDDCDGSRASPVGFRRKRKLHSKKNLAASSSSDPYKFKWIKRFSVSSSTASVQTSSTTCSSLNHYNCSNKQPSPKSILHGSQSRDMSSQQGAERKKIAHFDSDLPSNSSPSPDMSKSSSPDSLFRQQGGRSSLCRQNTSLSIVSSKDGDQETLDKLPNGNGLDRSRNSMTRNSFTATSTISSNHHFVNSYHQSEHNHQSLSCNHHYNFMRFKRGHKGRSESQPSVCSEMMAVQDLSKKQQMHSRRQVVVMLAFVVACFFLLFFPYRVFTIWLILSSDDQVHSLGMEAYYNLTYFSRILIYLHSAINPIAYNLISTKFRKAFMSILLCRGPATRRHFTTEHRIINSSKYVISDDKRSTLRQSQNK